MRRALKFKVQVARLLVPSPLGELVKCEVIFLEDVTSKTGALSTISNKLPTEASSSACSLSSKLAPSVAHCARKQF